MNIPFNPSGRPAQTTYPGGAVITSSYGNDGRPITLQVNGTTLISDIVYQPFGPAKSWTWGNGQTYTRQIDTDGRVSQYPVGTNTRSLVFDPTSRITHFTHAANPALDHAFGYDAVDRINQEVDNIGASLWTYDLNGNRTSHQPGSATYAYSYPVSSNRLQTVSGPVSKTYTYDAAGNPLSDGATAFTFNAAGRLSKVVRSGQTNQYYHNATGQRILKSGAYLVNGPYRFMYDSEGRLIGEYDRNNALRQETVWLDDTPIAVLKKNAQGQYQTYHVHADHLNTPRAILDQQNRTVWKWNSNAFGQGLPEEDPDGDGQTFEYHPRYPGQYFDKETGLHYNGARDYDPSTGRYPQFDPTGLEGGINGFGYANQNPLRFTDPLGLSSTATWGARLGAAGAMSAADGPAPIGDALAALYLIGSTVYDACREKDKPCKLHSQNKIGLPPGKIRCNYICKLGSGGRSFVTRIQDGNSCAAETDWVEGDHGF